MSRRVRTRFNLERSGEAMAMLSESDCSYWPLGMVTDNTELLVCSLMTIPALATYRVLHGLVYASLIELNS